MPFWFRDILVQISPDPDPRICAYD